MDNGTHVFLPLVRARHAPGVASGDVCGSRFPTRRAPALSATTSVSNASSSARRTVRYRGERARTLDPLPAMSSLVQCDVRAPKTSIRLGAEDQRVWRCARICNSTGEADTSGASVSEAPGGLALGGRCELVGRAISQHLPGRHSSIHVRPSWRMGDPAAMVAEHLWKRRDTPDWLTYVHATAKSAVRANLNQGSGSSQRSSVAAS
jgi:hypothetical protein